jgi:hypothetical protein
LAVSETSDPTGNWFLYRILADVFANNWADYPSIGFNKDWIVVSANMFSVNFASTFTGVQLYVFDKANVYTNGFGNHTLLHVSSTPFGLVRAFTMVPAVTYDRDLGEMYLMDIFNFQNQVHSRLRVSTISGDVGREVLRLGTSLTTNLVNWAASDFFGFAHPEPGLSQWISLVYPHHFSAGWILPHPQCRAMVANRTCTDQCRHSSIWPH